jgi:hypothetical protein
MWTAKSSFVSQLHVDGSGWNDCFPASLDRYLREVGLLSLSSSSAAELLGVALATRGLPDARGNADVTLGQADVALGHYALPVEWTIDWARTWASSFAICLVNGMRLMPAQYPASWFGGADWPDHFILRLPNGLYNDPLNPNLRDCAYDESSVREFFGGAYLLPLALPTSAANLFTVIADCSLKPFANHVCGELARFRVGTRVAAVGPETPHWRLVKTPHLVGWLLKSDLLAVK